ncbi:DUF3040 domain-containing protein [Geodermatophilus sp. SYSU D00703]
MLSDHEQRVWDDVERFWAVDAEEPPRSTLRPRRRARRNRADPPALVVAAVGAAILLVLFGAPTAGLAVGVATAVGWWVWRYWPRLGELGSATAWSVIGEVHRGSSAARRPERGAGER